MGPEPEKARDAVETETPALAATSARVVRCADRETSGAGQGV